MTSREICFLNVFFNITRGFEKVCEIFLDSSERKPRKSLAGAIYKEEKWRNGNKKKLLTTWECLNYKKSSQQSPSCVLSTRDSLFCKRFSPLFSLVQEKTRKKKKKEKTTVTHSPVVRVPLLCFTTFWRHLWFYYWTDSRQHGIYLLNIWIWDLWSILC